MNNIMIQSGRFSRVVNLTSKPLQTPALRLVRSCRLVAVRAQPSRRGGYVSASDDDEVCQDDLSGIWNCQFASESSEIDVVHTSRHSRETLEPMQLAARLLLEHGMGLNSSEAELMHSRFEGLASLDEGVQMTAAGLLLDAEHKAYLHTQENKRSHDDLLALIDASELQGLLAMERAAIDASMDEDLAPALRDPHEAATSSPQPTSSFYSTSPATSATDDNSTASHTVSAPFQSLAMHASWEEFSSLDGSGDGSFDGWPSSSLFDPSAAWDCPQDASSLLQAHSTSRHSVTEMSWVGEVVGKASVALSGVRLAAEEAAFDGLLGGDLMQCQWGMSWGAEGWEGSSMTSA